jgi:glycosyltransferase involved in cell wall biosynthesis
MPELVHIINLYPRKKGSFEAFLIELAAESAAKGWRMCFVFSREPAAWFRAELPADCEVRWVDGDPVREGFGKTLAAVRETKPDLLTFWFLSLFSPRTLLLTRWPGVGKSVYVDQTSWAVPERHGVMKLAAYLRGRIAGRCFHRVVSVSHYNRRRNIQQSYIPADRNIVIYNGAKSAGEREEGGKLKAEDASQRSEGTNNEQRPTNNEQPTTGNAPYFFYAGQVTEFKGVGTLIRAYAELARREEEANNQQQTTNNEQPTTNALPKLKLAGDGEGREALEQLARDLGVAGRVEFLGLRNDVQELMASSVANVIPSEWPEACAFVTFEAMASGRPLIVSDAGSLPELVGNCGTVFPKGDSDALKMALRDVLDRPEHHVRRAEQAIRRNAEMFGLDRMVQEYIDLFEGALREERST